MCRILALIGFVFCLAVPAAAQDASQVLLLRTNNLRGGLGLQAYRWNAQLAHAAQTHASWLATMNRNCRLSDCHRDEAGHYARDRARNAGYPGERVHENVYASGDPSANSAWSFWSNSPDHYQNLTSPNNSEIGIGSAPSAGGSTYFVQVFGHHSGGRGASAPAGSSSAAGRGRAATAANGQPSYVLGLDEYGNIKHEVQPGQTIGHILLIYGYTWDEYPYLLEINNMSEADRLNMRPGSVILVPPQDGTFTPAPAEARSSATATAMPIAAPRSTLAATSRSVPAVPPRSTPAPASRSTSALVIGVASVDWNATSQQATGADERTSALGSLAELVLLGAAVVLQLGILGGASVALLSGSR